MNKIAYYTGYTQGLNKMAIKAPSQAGRLLSKFVKTPGILLGAPIAGGYAGGRALASIQEPTKQEVSTVQAEYVKQKFQQAIEDLDKRKKIEQLKEQNLGNGNSLRI